MSKISDRLNATNTSLKTRKTRKRGTPHPSKKIIKNNHGDPLKIPIDKLSADPNQPRKSFDPKSLQELSESIKDHGILQPILVREVNGDFLIVAGERRYRAAKIAGLEILSCILTTGSPGEISLIENIQREDLTALETANAMHQMMEEYQYTQDQMSKIINKSVKTVSAILSLLKLPNQIKNDLSRMRENKISRRKLIDIVQTKDEKEAIELYNAAKDGATSNEIREKRKHKAIEKKGSSIRKRSDYQILTEKIELLIKAFERIEDPKRFKGKLRSLLDELETQFIRFK